MIECTEGEILPMRFDQRGKLTMATKMLTPKEIALDWDISAKTLRKFLRFDARTNGAETPGKGKRWEIPASQVKSLRKRFDAWVAQNAKNRSTEGEATEVTEAVTEVEAIEATE
jgi:hypothetical protein